MRVPANPWPFLGPKQIFFPLICFCVSQRLRPCRSRRDFDSLEPVRQTLKNESRYRQIAALLAGSLKRNRNLVDDRRDDPVPEMTETEPSTAETEETIPTTEAIGGER